VFIQKSREEGFEILDEFGFGPCVQENNQSATVRSKNRRVMDVLLETLSARRAAIAGAAIAGTVILYQTVAWIAKHANEDHAFLTCKGMQSRNDRGDALGANSYFLNKDGLRIFFRSWIEAAALPRKTRSGGGPRAVVVISHGFGEHSGRYEHIGSELARRGFVVYALDHQGHGASEGDRGYVKRFRDYATDVLKLVDICKKRHGDRVEFFLVGHSMGGAIAVDVGIVSPDVWSGIVLSGPLLMADPKVNTPIMRTAAKALSRFLPKICLDAVDANEVSSDPLVNSNYKNDPLVYKGGIRSRWAVEVMRAWGVFAKEVPRWKIPFWIGHGKEDHLCMKEGSVAFFEETATPKTRKQIVMYDGLRHEIFNENIERDSDTLVNRPIRDAIAWIESRLRR